MDFLWYVDGMGYAVVTYRENGELHCFQEHENLSDCLCVMASFFRSRGAWNAQEGIQELIDTRWTSKGEIGGSLFRVYDHEAMILFNLKDGTRLGPPIVPQWALDYLKEHGTKR